VDCNAFVVVIFLGRADGVRSYVSAKNQMVAKQEAIHAQWVPGGRGFAAPC